MINNKKPKKDLFDEIGKLNDKITELEKNTIKGKQSVEQLTAIYQNAPFIMMLVDEERRVRKVNKATIEFADSVEEELIGLRGGEALRCLHN